MVLLDNCACSRIEVYSQSGEKYHPYLYGTYLRRAEKVNGRPFYTSDDHIHGIWWYQDNSRPRYEWKMGHSSDKGTTVGWASNLQDVDCPQSTKNFSWWMNSIYIIDSYQQWRTVGYALDIRCLPDDNFKGHEISNFKKT